MVLHNQLLSFDLLSMLCQMHTERLLTFAAGAIAGSWTTWCPLAQPVPSQQTSSPACAGAWGYCSFGAGHGWSVSPFLWPDKVLWMVTQSCSEQTTPPSSVLSAIQSCLFLRSFVASIKISDSRTYQVSSQKPQVLDAWNNIFKVLFQLKSLNLSIIFYNFRPASRGQMLYCSDISPNKSEIFWAKHVNHSSRLFWGKAYYQEKNSNCINLFLLFHL